MTKITTTASHLLDDRLCTNLSLAAELFKRSVERSSSSASICSANIICQFTKRAGREGMNDSFGLLFAIIANKVAEVGVG